MSSKFKMPEDWWMNIFRIIMPDASDETKRMKLYNLKQLGYIKKSIYDEAVEAYEREEWKKWLSSGKETIEKLKLALDEEHEKRIVAEEKR